ncbi:uncharacterized protein SCHCODRAFT_02633241 [Schizophyllum commune H4-8]|nr:uncharacterized protein SCHCODRAFT_02633241 [Schizophyllum commune H4-8]KAI5888975.1 hypothetical protein SCHCODRAFT_02633241 [Schizophyllum commune H4-8]
MMRTKARSSHFQSVKSTMDGPHTDDMAPSGGRVLAWARLVGMHNILNDINELVPDSTQTLSGAPHGHQLYGRRAAHGCGLHGTLT